MSIESDLRAQLAERDALLADVSVSVTGRNGTFARIPADWFDRRDALSACAGPSIKMVRAHKHTCANVQPWSTSADACDCGAVTNGKPVPVERDEQQAFAQWTHEVVEFEHRGITRKIQRCDLMDSEAEKNAWAGWQARAGLDKATEGASHE
jgi:hypothetical protein